MSDGRNLLLEENHQYYDEHENTKKNKNKIVVRPRTRATAYRPERQEVGMARKCKKFISSRYMAVPSSSTSYLHSKVAYRVEGKLRHHIDCLSSV